MVTYELMQSNDMNELVAAVYSSSDPLCCLKNGDECLIAMQPSVFERLLCETDLLNQHERATFHL